MIKMKKYIDLRDYGYTAKDAENIKKQIRERLGKNIFNFPDFQTLQFEALRQISTTRNSIKNNPQSIFNAAGKVMQHFEFPKVIIKKLNSGNQFEEIISKKEESQLDLFNYWILGFDTTPHQELHYLKKNVECHLRYILDLIGKYEEKKYIQVYKESGKNPNGNFERMLLDFYRRCLKERDLILDYYLNGIEDRAILRANSKLGLPTGLTNTPFYDFPYRSWTIYMDEYFDYEKINCASHRLFDNSLGENSTSLYNKNKQLFYRKLFKKKPLIQIFSNIDYYYNHIPYSNNRLPIIIELKRLFKAKRWLPFYALALPQVEGLFTEMLNTINPNENGKSLSEKVEKVRPSYNLSDAYFDYYQYKITDIRNKFAHIGFEDDLKLKCFDLLTDLEHILHVYFELDNPLVKIKRLMKQRNPMDFVSYIEISQFFDLINKLHHSQRKLMKPELEDFVNSFLINNCQLEYIVNEAKEYTRKIIGNLIHRIEKTINSSEIAIAFENKNLKELKIIIEQNKIEFAQLYKFQNYEFDDLYELKNFAYTLRKHFNVWASVEKESFLLLIKENEQKINNLIEIRGITEE